MFEKCGLRDIFYVIWKHKYFIIGIAALFFIIGLFMSGGEENSPVVSQTEGTWVASAYYLVSVSEEIDTGDSTAYQVQDKDILMAHTLSNILNADYSAEIIYDQLLEKYTKRQLIDGLNLGVSEDILTFFDVHNAYSVSVLESSPVVIFYVAAKDKEMAQSFLDLCRIVFEEIPSVVEHSSIQYLNGVTAVKYENTGEDLSVENESNHSVLIFVIIGIFLSLVIVVAIAVFRPTINRKSDFSFYGISVIGELPSVKENIGDTYEK